jgi:hypothetical protein
MSTASAACRRHLGGDDGPSKIVKLDAPGISAGRLSGQPI